MDKERMETREERRRQEDQIFNKLLVWFGGAVAYEFVAIFLKRFFINYNYTSEQAIRFSLSIGVVLGLLRYIAPVLTIAALAWGVVCRKKGKSLVVPAVLTLVGALITFTAFVAYHYRDMGVSLLGAVAPVVAAMAIVYFLYQKEFFLNAIMSGSALVALWVYRKAYALHPKMVLVGFVFVWIVMAAVLFLAWKMSRNGGKVGKVQVVEKETNYLLTYVTAAVSALALVFALAFGATFAYYAIFAVGALVFFMVVYYTVRMM